MIDDSISKILIADDNASLLHAVRKSLERQRFEVDFVTNASEALEKLSSNSYSVLLLKSCLDNQSTIQILKKIREQNILTRTIVVSEKRCEESAKTALMRGASAHFVTPVDPTRLNTVIMQAAEQFKFALSDSRYHSESKYGDIIGQSDTMRSIYRMIDTLADSTANVVIYGESGTGKELIARAIHKRGSRASAPFVAVNCSAFPNEILENELFGHEEGAFTGALKEKPGCFELANHGTLFLDEICDMSLGAQAKILRVLEERCFRRLGGKNEIAVDVRVICASNKKLEKAVEEKKLREDLFYRLNVIEIEVPALRDRTDDLELLINDFLSKFSKKNGKNIKRFSIKAEEVLLSHNWPGNVRELKNAIERAVVLCHGDMICIDHLPKKITNSEQKNNEFRMPVGSKLQDVERELIFHTLEHMDNNKTRAARVLGISLKTLHNKLNLYQAKGIGNVNST